MHLVPKSMFTGCLALFATVLWAQPAASPAGYILSEENCASGGPDHHFCANGTIISALYGGEDQPLVEVGTWSLKGQTISVTYHTRYGGRGEGEVQYASSVNQYDSYRAYKEKINETTSFDWSDALGTEDCTEIRKESKPSCDPHSYLRTSSNDLNNRFFFASERLLTESELSGYSKSDLRIMRNAIYARYGYRFKTADMQKQFNSSQALSDVSAFLSDIELKNVELIKKVENL